MTNCDEETISNSGYERDGKKHICKERSNIFFLVRLREAQRRREQCITCKIFVRYLYDCRVNQGKLVIGPEVTVW